MSASSRKQPRMSVFTPSHDPRWLDDCHRSLMDQTFADWEWVVVLSGGATQWSPPVPDERIRVASGRFPRKVGAAKHAACELCEGDILVELDHDDILAPDCLAEINAAFEANPSASLVFSDFAQINEDGSPNFDRFDPAMGWEYSEEQICGQTYLRCHGMAPYPHNVSYIWYAPNHPRAFQRSAYIAAGGYNPNLAVLDDQDLMMRLFLVGDFEHIHRCLYLQRMHAANTQRDPATNSFIQEETVRFYDRYIADLASAWSRRNDLAVVTVVTPTSPKSDDPDPGDVLIIDPERPSLPFEDDSVGVIKGTELLQRLPDRIGFFNECYRVLVHGGMALTHTPSTDGRGAFQDPNHVSFWNENSFWYLTQDRLRPLLGGYVGRFQVSRIRTWFPTDWEREVNISYVQTHLMAIKDGPRLGGPLLC